MRRAARSLRDKEKAILVSLAAAERRHVVMLLRVEKAYVCEQADKENMNENPEVVPPADACVIDIAT
jgi:rubrerythrin